MAKIIGGLGAGLRGSIDNLSFYKMRGVEDTIVRTKGGFTKERIQTDPKLERLRLAESEFGAKSTAGSYIMQALTFQKPMADYNLAGPLIKDPGPHTEAGHGRRIWQTRYSYLLISTCA